MNPIVSTSMVLQIYIIKYKMIYWSHVRTQRAHISCLPSWDSVEMSHSYGRGKSIHRTSTVDFPAALLIYQSGEGGRVFNPQSGLELATFRSRADGSNVELPASHE